jgi:hypothetical protein
MHVFLCLSLFLLLHFFLSTLALTRSHKKIHATVKSQHHLTELGNPLPLIYLLLIPHISLIQVPLRCRGNNQWQRSPSLAVEGFPLNWNLVTEATIDREQYRGAIHHLLFIHGGNLDLIFLLRNLVLP